MPKAKARKKGTGRHVRTTGISRSGGNASNDMVDRTTSSGRGSMARTASVRARQGQGGYQGLVMPGMVALGCWGLAISFIFFTPDPNHLLYGGIAVLMALMWSFSFGLRLRRLRQAQQK